MQNSIQEPPVYYHLSSLSELLSSHGYGCQKLRNITTHLPKKTFAIFSFLSSQQQQSLFLSPLHPWFSSSSSSGFLRYNIYVFLYINSHFRNYLALDLLEFLKEANSRNTHLVELCSSIVFRDWSWWKRVKARRLGSAEDMKERCLLKCQCEILLWVPTL